MKTLGWILAQMLWLTSVQAQMPFQVAWQRIFGATNTDQLRCLRQTSDGGYVVAGTSYGKPGGNKTSTNYGDYDGWVIKLDAAGNKLWDADFGGTNTEVLSGIEQTGDGGYIVSGSSFSGVSGNRTNVWYGSQDGWLLKLDSGGSMVWEQGFGGTSLDGLNAVRPTSDGGYIVCGSTFSPVSGNKTSPAYGLTDAWVIKVNADGSKAWEQSFGGTSSDGALGLDLTSDGGYIIAGDSSSGVSGSKTSPNYGSSDYWVIKLDSNGNEQWDNTFGGSSSETATKVLQTSDGGFIVGGYSSSGISGNKSSTNYGGSDFWVVKLDSSGNKTWDRSYGGSGNEELRDLQITPDGGYLLGGYSASPVSGNKTSPNFGGADYWLVKLDAAGTKVWEQSFGGTNDDYLYSLRQTSDGGCILGGYSSSPVSGNKTVGTYGSSDFWLIKLSLPVPQLTTQPSGSLLTLSWPSPSTDYVLEQSSNLVAVSWVGVGSPLNDDGTNKTVTLTMDAAKMFFRLRKP